MSWRLTLLLVPLLAACIGGGTADDDDDDDGGDGDGGGWDLGVDSGTGDLGGTDAGGTDSGGTDGGGTDSGGGGGDGGGGDGGDGGGGDGGGGDGGGGDGGGSDWDGDVEGRAWRLDLGGATFVEPAGVGSLIGGMIEQDILVQAERATSTELDLIFTVSEGVGGPQDMCTPTSELPTGDFSDAPDWQVGPATITMATDGYEIPMRRVTITGTFSADGRTYDDSTLDATIDNRDLVPMWRDLLGTSDPGEVCDLVASFGVSCEPCSDGVELCLGLRIEDVVADPYPGGIEIRTEGDIAEDPSCG